MRRLMHHRTLYAAILFLVGLVATGIPGYGAAEPPIAPPPAALQNAEPSGSPQEGKFPPCPDPPPKTQAMPLTPNPDPTRPPIIDPSMLVPGGGGASACDGTKSRFEVQQTPGTLLPSGIVVPPAPGPAPCPEECLKIYSPEDQEKIKQGLGR